MDKDTPSWLAFLVLFFAITTIASLGALLYYHAQASAVYEEWIHRTQLKIELEKEQQRLKDKVESYTLPIEQRREKLASLKAVANEQELDVRDLQIPNHNMAVSNARESIAVWQKNMDEAIEEMNQASEDLIQEMITTLEAERKADTDRNELRDHVQKQSQELEQVKKEYLRKLEELRVDIDQRQARVQELVDRVDTESDELVSDGRILEANGIGGYAIIDRGHKHNLRRGTRFTVYNRRGGKNIIKGQLEVVRVDPRIAVCRVLEELDANDPLIPGDHIHNKVYNPNETKVFVIDGIFAKFDEEELGRLIIEAGGRVEDELSIRTDFLVAGDDSQAAIDKASLLGVSILSENQLLDFIRTPYRFQVRQGMTFVLSGDFDLVSRELIVSYIRRSGGVIEQGIGSGLHVLIAGRNAADAIAQARSLGATVLTQDQLIHLVNPESRTLTP